MFLEPLAQCSFSLTNVCVSATLVFFRCLVFSVNYHGTKTRQKCSFSLTDVCVSAVIVTCDVVDSPTLVFFRCLVFSVNEDKTKEHQCGILK